MGFRPLVRVIVSEFLVFLSASVAKECGDARGKFWEVLTTFLLTDPILCIFERWKLRRPTRAWTKEGCILDAIR